MPQITQIDMPTRKSKRGAISPVKLAVRAGRNINRLKPKISLPNTLKIDEKSFLSGEIIIF